MYKRLNREVRAMYREITELTYFMRGGMSYEHILYSMSYIQREIAIEFVEKRLETEMKSVHPNY